MDTQYVIITKSSSQKEFISQREKYQGWNIFNGNLKDFCHFGGQGLDRRIILKWIKEATEI
jgi:hypothetical protein